MTQNGEVKPRRVECPLEGYEDAYIELPGVWLGFHAQRKDQAVEAASKYNSETLTSFAASMALLDDWELPGLPGNVEKWDFLKLDLSLMAWVSLVVLSDYGSCFIIKKKQSLPLSIGLKETPEPSLTGTSTKDF